MSHVRYATFGEELSEDTPSCPQINLDSIVRIAVEELRRSVVSCGDVGDTSLG